MGTIDSASRPGLTEPDQESSERDAADGDETPRPTSASSSIEETQHDEREPLATSDGASGSTGSEAGTADGFEIAKLLAWTEAIESSLERLWRLDEKREERFDQLHGELETYRQGQHERVADPYFSSLIKLRDGFSKRLRAWRSKDLEEVPKQRLLALLEDCIDDVDLVLEHHGVTAFEEPAESFSRERQVVVRTLPCDDERVGRLAERVSPGFEKGARILIKERVAVYAQNRHMP